MWHTGQPAEAPCEGSTFSTTHINELSYLNSRDVSYATFCQGPYEESSRYRDFIGCTVPWYGWDGQVLRTPVPAGAACRPTSQDN
jgi:hypothetical protein